MSNKIYFLSKLWHRHGGYSGYELLIKFIKAKHVVINSFFMTYALAQFFNKRTLLINYKSDTVSKEIGLLFNIFNKKTIHVLYGDMDYYYLHFIKRFPFNVRRNTLVATFHHPPYELEQRMGYNRDKVLGALDKIIVMGPNQIPFLSQYTNADIRFIPHGIDLDYFVYNQKAERVNRILLIGISHRDHQRNIEIIKACNLKFNTSFIVVMPKAYANLYKHLEHTTLISHQISDLDLLWYYQSSKGVLLSLKDCTASNTILEALACGCPLITNNVGAVLDYIPKSSGVPIFETDDISGTLDYIERLLTEIDFFEDISAKQRKLAKKYDWHLIAKATEDFIFND